MDDLETNLYPLFRQSCASDKIQVRSLVFLCSSESSRVLPIPKLLKLLNYFLKFWIELRIFSWHTVHYHLICQICHSVIYTGSFTKQPTKIKHQGMSGPICLTRVRPIMPQIYFNCQKPKKKNILDILTNKNPPRMELEIFP